MPAAHLKAPSASGIRPIQTDTSDVPGCGAKKQYASKHKVHEMMAIKNRGGEAYRCKHCQAWHYSSSVVCKNVNGVAYLRVGRDGA